MSPDVQPSLSKFEAAIRNSDFETAEETLRTVQESYEQILAEEEAQVSQALQARDTQGLPDDEREVLQEYISTAAAVGLTRSGFLMTAAAYLSDPNEVSTSRVLEAIETLQTQESEITGTARSAASVLSDVALPSNVTFLTSTLSEGPYLKGESITATATVANVGDESASSTTVVVDAPSQLGVEPTQIDLGSLQGNDSRDITTSVSLDEGGEYTLTFEVDADTGGDTEPLELEVETKRDLIESILASIENLIDQLENDSDIPDGTAKSLVSKLDATRRKVEKAATFAQNGRAKQSNNMLTAAANILGAFLNEIAAGNSGRGKGNGNSGKRSRQDAKTLRRSVERLIERIAAARRAEL